MKVVPGRPPGNVRFDYFDGLFYYFLFFEDHRFGRGAKRGKGIRQFFDHVIGATDVEGLLEIEELVLQEFFVDTAVEIAIRRLFIADEEIGPYAQDIE